MPPFCLAKVEGGMNVNITRKNTSHVITLSTTDTAEVNKILFDTGDGFLRAKRLPINRRGWTCRYLT